MISIEPFSVILAALTAVASGMVGSFALMRRMTLAGDALSHVALPGIGLALLYSYHPVAGGAVALLFGAFVVWKIGKMSPVNTEAVIGVLFAISLAVGTILIKEEHELIATLFGGIASVQPYEFFFGSIIAVLVIRFIVHYRHALVLMLVSRELATTAGVSIEKLQLLFLLMFSLTVILGMKFLGVLLMGSLIIIPAAAARNVAKNLNEMLGIASAIALASVLAGIFLSAMFSMQLGPVIIIIAGIFFTATLFLHVLKTREYA